MTKLKKEKNSFPICGSSHSCCQIAKYDIRQAATELYVPKCTLDRYVNNRNEIATASAKHLENIL